MADKTITQLTAATLPLTGTEVLPLVQSGTTKKVAQLDLIQESNTWTPTFTNLTIGNGTATGKYIRIGKLVFLEVAVVWGSTTSASGSWYVNNIPFTAVAGFRAYGSCNILDSGTANFYGGCSISESTTNLFPLYLNAAGTYLSQANVNATAPMTWTTSDELKMSITYAAA